MDRYESSARGRSPNQGATRRRRVERPEIETLEGRLCLSSSPVSATATMTSIETPTAGQGNAPVFLSAHVKYSLPSVAGPTGSVEFDDVTTHQVLGTVMLDATGTATLLVTNSVPAAGDAVRASFRGGQGADPSDTEATVQPASTSDSNATTTKFDTPLIGPDNSPMSLTAHVSYNDPTIDGPSGAVEFEDVTTGKSLGAVEVDPSGLATLIVPPGGAAVNDTIRASFLGGPAANASQADAVVQSDPISGLYATTTALDQPTIAPGAAPLLLTAHVKYNVNIAGRPPGTVVFEDVTTNALLGVAAVTPAGDASFLVPPGLAAVNQTVRASFLGGPAANPSHVDAVIQAAPVTVSSATTTTLDGPNTAQGGNAIQLTAHVAYSSPSSNALVGSVEFEDVTANKVLATVKLDSSGAATLQLPLGLSVGDHTVRATFLGSTTANVSHADHDLQVAATPTSLALMAPVSAVASTPVTISAVVTASNVAVHNGTVTFFDGGTPLGSSPVNNSGVATLTLQLLAPGGHSLTADFTPAQDSGLVASTTSTPTGLQIVGNPTPTPSTTPIDTTTMLTASLVRPARGTRFHRPLVEFQAHVSSGASSSAQGQVALLVAGRRVAVASLDAGGTATFMVPLSIAQRRPALAQFLGGAAGGTPLLASQSPTLVTTRRSLVRMG